MSTDRAVPAGNILHEKLITFARAADLICEITGGAFKPNFSTLHRWALRGSKGRVLETRDIGRKRFTSAEAVRRFIAGMPPAPVTQPPATSQLTSKAEELRRKIFRQPRSPGRSVA